MIKKLFLWFIILEIIGAIFIYWDVKTSEEQETSIFYVPNVGEGTISVVNL
ncbi:hypothetical protein ACTQ5K_20625 [Niallia sp. Sow4_A1]|uniref:hypothetical protein n=1 Tax=Bacillaceae TaxID=186817 RepID=UPI000A845513|nr:MULTISPECIES: hypothetical protein [Bacillaceae]MCM3364404.1 hypothetical protein [Niallia sp. MER TA 168]